MSEFSRNLDEVVESARNERKSAQLREAQLAVDALRANQAAAEAREGLQPIQAAIAAQIREDVRAGYEKLIELEAMPDYWVNTKTSPFLREQSSPNFGRYLNPYLRPLYERIAPKPGSDPTDELAQRMWLLAHERVGAHYTEELSFISEASPQGITVEIAHIQYSYLLLDTKGMMWLKSGSIDERELERGAIPEATIKDHLFRNAGIVAVEDKHLIPIEEVGNEDQIKPAEHPRVVKIRDRLRRLVRDVVRGSSDPS